MMCSKCEDENSESDASSSSDISDTECEKRRVACLRQMIVLEKQFSALKNELYSVRSKNIETRYEALRNESCEIYRRKIAELEEKFNIPGAGEEQAGCVHQMMECEEYIADQDMENEKAKLFDQLKYDIESKITKLEQDKHQADAQLEMWLEENNKKKLKKESGFKKMDLFKLLDVDRLTKPVVVSGPCLFYLLKDDDIMDDWETIRKGFKPDVGASIQTRTDSAMLNKMEL